MNLSKRLTEATKQVARLKAANAVLAAALREELAERIDALGVVVFVSDDKEREMLAKSVVLTVIRQAPLKCAALSDTGAGWLPLEVREQAGRTILYLSRIIHGQHQAGQSFNNCETVSCLEARQALAALGGK